MGRRRGTQQTGKSFWFFFQKEPLSGTASRRTVSNALTTFKVFT